MSPIFPCAVWVHVAMSVCRVRDSTFNTALRLISQNSEAGGCRQRASEVSKPRREVGESHRKEDSDGGLPGRCRSHQCRPELVCVRARRLRLRFRTAEPVGLRDRRTGIDAEHRRRCQWVWVCAWGARTQRLRGLCAQQVLRCSLEALSSGNEWMSSCPPDLAGGQAIPVDARVCMNT